MKCKKCNKKTILYVECKCGNNYCIKCLGTHDCDFDYKEHNKTLLGKQNVKIIGEKLNKI